MWPVRWFQSGGFYGQKLVDLKWSKWAVNESYNQRSYEMKVEVLKGWRWTVSRNDNGPSYEIKVNRLTQWKWTTLYRPLWDDSLEIVYFYGTVILVGTESSFWNNIFFRSHDGLFECNLNILSVITCNASNTCHKTLHYIRYNTGYINKLNLQTWAHVLTQSRLLIGYDIKQNPRMLLRGPNMTAN